MKLRYIVAVLGLALFTSSAKDASAAPIQWGQSFPEAQMRSEGERKPIFVYFYTDWCGQCKNFEAETLSNPGVQQLLTGFISLKLNADKEGAQLAKQYNVNSYPRLLFLNSKGQVLKEIKGWYQAEGFQSVLREQLQQAGSGIPATTQGNAGAENVAAPGAGLATGGLPSLETQLIQSNALRIALANKNPRQFKGKVLPESPRSSLTVMPNGLIVVAAPNSRPAKAPAFTIY